MKKEILFGLLRVVDLNTVYKIILTKLRVIVKLILGIIREEKFLAQRFFKQIPGSTYPL